MPNYAPAIAPACIPMQQRFRAHAASVARVRHVITDAAQQGLLGPAADKAEITDALCLIASELVTNAITHHQGADNLVEVTLWAADGHLWISVADGGPGQPVLHRPPDTSAHGRGLLLVAALAASWGVLPRPGCPGKVVYAAVQL